MNTKCAICGCPLHRTKGTYALPTPSGRSHASEHHYVPERFFGRSSNRKGTQRKKLFESCPWGYEGKRAVFCYDCHEELIHNPILLPDDIAAFAKLVTLRGLSEENKSESREKLAGRIRLFHEAIKKGLDQLLKEESQQGSEGTSSRGRADAPHR